MSWLERAHLNQLRCKRTFDVGDSAALPVPRPTPVALTRNPQPAGQRAVAAIKKKRKTPFRGEGCYGYSNGFDAVRKLAELQTIWYERQEEKASRDFVPGYVQL